MSLRRISGRSISWSRFQSEVFGRAILSRSSKLKEAVFTPSRQIGFNHPWNDHAGLHRDVRETTDLNDPASLRARTLMMEGDAPCPSQQAPNGDRENGDPSTDPISVHLTSGSSILKA